MENPQQLKTCTACKREKPITEFSSYTQTKTGRTYMRSFCNVCKNIKHNKYYNDNKDKFKNSNKKFRENNPDYHKNYQENHRDYYNQYMKNYYQKNTLKKEVHNLQVRLLNCIITKSNSMESIIGMNIHDFIKWLNFTKVYNVTEERNNIVIEHLIEPSNISIEKYMHWTNTRYMSKSQNSKKKNKLSFEDQIRHQHLIHCFVHNKEPSIERKLIY